MVNFSDYGYVFPKFHKYLNHATADDCVAQMVERYKKKLVYKFFKTMVESNWQQDINIRLLADCAMKALDTGRAPIPKKKTERFYILRANYLSEKTENVR